MFSLTVGELKQQLTSIPDDAPVCVGIGDLPPFFAYGATSYKPATSEEEHNLFIIGLHPQTVELLVRNIKTEYC